MTELHQTQQLRYVNRTAGITALGDKNQTEAQQEDFNQNFFLLQKYTIFPS